MPKRPLSILESEDFDIILADIKMPGMDGLEMLRRIKSLNKDAIVIVMTAFATVDTAVKALKDGAYDYVTKPFDPDDLSHLIRNACKQIVLTDENETLKKKVFSLENVEDLIGNSEAMKNVLREVESVAQYQFLRDHHRGKRNGKGTYRQGDPFQFSSEVLSLGECALRRPDRKPAGKRIVRA